MSMLQGLLVADVALIAVLAGCVAQLIKTAHLRALADGSVEQREVPFPRIVVDTLEEDDDVAPPLAAAAGVATPVPVSIEQIPIVYLGPALPEIAKVEAAPAASAAAEPSQSRRVGAAPAAAVEAATVAVPEQPNETMAWSDLPIASTDKALDKNRILTGIVPLPTVREVDLYADPIDGVPFEQGEPIVMCECGTAYRESTRLWLLEHADCTCVQCHRTLPEAAHAFGEQKQLELEIAQQPA